MIATPLQPLGHYVLLKQVEPQAVTEGGIVLPTVAQEKTNEGIVLAVGPGRKNTTTGMVEPIGVKVGDRVVYGKYSATEIKYGREEYLLVDEQNLYAVVQTPEVH